jgi:hypothetical protein
MEFGANGEEANHEIARALGNGVISALHISHGHSSFRTTNTIFVILADARLQHQ